MYGSGHVRLGILTAVAVLFTAGEISAQSNVPRATAQLSSTSQNFQSNQVKAVVRWGSRPGVSRYRLQLAADRDFTDIVFDRVVNGTEYRISDLEPGRYFWRVAPLTSTLGEYSGAGILEVPRELPPVVLPTPQRIAVPIPAKPTPTANSIVTGNGWRAAIGDISRPLVAHLRSASGFDLVGVTNDGVIYALDATSGVALWTARSAPSRPPAMRTSGVAPFLMRSPAGLDNVIVLNGSTVTAREGRSGRVMWSATLPAPAFSGTVISNGRASEIYVLDSSLQRLFLLDGQAGTLLSRARLPGRVVGAPVSFDFHGTRGILLAFDDGRVQIIDRTGKVLKSGDSDSQSTTAPLFVSGPRGGLILLGTRSGLTAFSADDFRPLGRVAIQDDAPRGTLTAADLDGDGVAEVIVLTDRGRVLAVNAADGKTIWQTTGAPDAGSVAFVDLNRDRVLDVLIAAGQSFAQALSGRDGSVVWKQDGQLSFAANHAVPPAPRSVVVVPFGGGALVIASDPSHTSLRAVEFPQGVLGNVPR